MHFLEYKSSKNHHYEPDFRNYEKIDIYRELSSKINFIWEVHNTLLNRLSAEYINPFFKFEFISVNFRIYMVYGLKDMVPQVNDGIL